LYGQEKYQQLEICFKAMLKFSLEEGSFFIAEIEKSTVRNRAVPSFNNKKKRTD